MPTDQKLSVADRLALVRMAQAAGLKQARAELPPIERVDRSGRLPLSYAQQRLWFLEQMGGLGRTYHIPGRLGLRGALDRGALVRALDRIVERHEALRTTFAVVNGEPEQRIAPESTRFHLVEHDLVGQGREELERVAAEEAAAPFDLERGPLIRGRLVRLAEDDHLLLLTMHHIVFDGWSIGVLTRELGRLYGAFRAGEPDPLPELPIQYADYAAWQRRWVEDEVLEAQAGYWTRTLAGAPALLELPTDHPRPARPDHGGASVGMVLDEPLTAGLKALSRRHGTTLFMTLLAGWAVVLGRLSGQEDVVVGTPTANRGRKEIEALIGFFVNTLALRVKLSARPTVAELLEQVKRRVLGAQQNQDIPFEQVVERVDPVRTLAYSPLFQVVFDWQNHPGAELPGDEPARAAGADRTTAKFDLMLSLRDAEGRIAGNLTYATSLFERATVERHLACLRQVLEAMVADELQAVDALPLLPDAERRLVVDEWNRAESHPAGSCLHTLFERQVERAPGGVAVTFADQSLTYAALNARANRLAHHLIARGVGPDARVAICVERSLEMVVALLAVLKAGGGYVPLDPGYPEDRLRYTLADSRPVLLLTQAALRERLTDLDLPVVSLDADAPSWAGLPETNPDRADVGPEHLAYVIYTSGSTGQPKGVMVEHRNVARLFTATDAWFGFGADDVWTLFHSFAFDFSVWEIWGALLYGGRLVVVPFEVSRSPEDFYALLCREGVTVLNQTPSAFRQLIAAQASSDAEQRLRYVVFGGEALELATLRPWFERNDDRRTRLVNMYGITETTVHVTYRPVVAADAERAGPSPIGVRIPDLKTCILDARGGPVPIGVVGELYVGGAGVARGYLNRPELTAERFVRDPFSTDPEARLYRTGDLARWLADGTLEYLGRNDHQVKIRGFRIELGEIEARLAEHPEVREVVVLAREGADGSRQLVAWYVGTGDAGDLEAAELRAHLAARLPEYMVPAAYVRLEAVPLTPNGKVDHQALPSPEGDAYVTRGYEAPLGETETALAEIWAQVLGVERVGRWDHFFELGGHSLMAVRLIERMRQRGLHVEVRALFTTPTLWELASAVSHESAEVIVPPNAIPAGCDAITPAMLPLVELSQAEIDRIVAGVPGGAANVQDIYPLAPLQEGMFFHHLMEEDHDPYLVAHLLTLDTRSGVDAFLGALQRVVDRHDVLRTAVVWEGLREPVQVVWRKTVLPVEEVALDAAEGDVAAQLWERFHPRTGRLDIRQAPMMRFFVAPDPARERWVLLWWFSHLVQDHQTVDDLISEVEAHVQGRAHELPPAMPYRNYVAQARLGVSADEHERFFRELLGDVTEPTAPFGVLDARGDGTGIAEARLRVDAELSRRLREQAQALGVSAASVFHLAWAQVLARVSGRDDVVFGTVLFGRMAGGAGADRVMGMLINTLPVRLRVGAEGAEAAVRGTHAQLAGLLRHEHASLALAQRCSGVAAPAPLFTSLLNYRHSTRGGEKKRAQPDAAPQSTGIKQIVGQERTNYPVGLWVDDAGEGFRLTAQTVAAIDPQRLCAFMHQALERLVEALVAAPATPLRELDVLPEAERRLVLEEWNRTGRPFPREACIHQLFEAQAGRTPGAVALAWGAEELTYRQLDTRANRLAHHLAGLGVGPESRVGLRVERSVENVVATLAVLKAGGCCVPVDMSYPAERMALMLADSAVRVLLSDGELAAPGLHVVRLDQVAEVLAAGPDHAPPGNASAENLAYVFYTSGSTGRPKGVMMGHREVVQFVSSLRETMPIGPGDRVGQGSNASFDAAVFEIWGALLNGATLVGIERDVLLSAPLLGQALREERITTLYQTAALFNQHVREQVDVYASLRQLVFGAEAVGTESVRRMLREGKPAHVLHEYGPTEATVWCTLEDVREVAEDAPTVLIGRPIPNARGYVLDAAGEPLPVDVTGELCIGGAGVVRGYLGRPGLTAERFVPDPFAAEPGARMYRTGDRARWTAEGKLEFMGRVDDQVKIRGFRIEPGEVEAAIAAYPGVREARVMMREDQPGDKRLVAYVAGSVETDGLRAHLRGSLPEYMVPAAYVHLEALPLTPNGKIDRKALPAPGSDAYAAREYEAPVGETEEALAEIWAEVLGVERIGRHDDFFEMGGHSLLATRLALRIQRSLDVDVTLRDVFEKSVLSALAQHIVLTQLAEFDPEELARLDALDESG